MKKFFITAGAFTILIAALFFPSPAGLTAGGKNTIGLAVFFLVMLIGKTVPMPVACMLLIVLMPVSGVTKTIGDALTGFSNPVLYFTIASFCLSCAFVSVPLSNRILRRILTHFAKSTKSLILSVMICESLVSSVISNIPTTVIFISLSRGILNTVAEESDRKSIGRALMIGVIFSSMIGGMMTPAGSSLNMLAISLLQKSTGITITFIQWIFVGIPLVAVLIPAAWFLIIHIYKPAELKKGSLEACARSVQVTGRMDLNEKIFIAILSVTVALWIMSSWITSIDVTVTAIISACACFLPNLNILSAKKFESMANWDVFFVQGAALSLGFAMIANGVDKWFAEVFLYTLPPLPVFILTSVCALFVFFMLILIPIAPAMISIFAVQFISLAAAQNIPPAMLIFILALCTANCYLLPLDSVPVLGLQTGYFSMPEIAKSAAALQIFIVLLLSLWLPVICPAIGVI